MNDAGHNAGPIDAVITWVDGADPAHAARLAAYLDSIGAGRPNAAPPTRFHDAGETSLEQAEKGQPWGRLIKPDEVARTVAFLCSAESGLMTGTVFDFDQAVRGPREQIARMDRP